jgi:hypothetical protein
VVECAVVRGNPARADRDGCDAADDVRPLTGTHPSSSRSGGGSRDACHALPSFLSQGVRPDRDLPLPQFPRAEAARSGIFHFAICIFHFSFSETPHGTPNEKWPMKNAKCKMGSGCDSKLRCWAFSRVHPTPPAPPC